MYICAQERFILLGIRIKMNESVPIMNHTVLSYFCGCGGLDLGFTGGFEYRGQTYQAQPFDFLGAYDNNPQCIESYNKYFKHKATVADLSHLDPTTVPSADVLLGGFPCQDFSSCGPLRGLSSERGKLYQVMLRYMNVHKPMVVVGENVLNLERMQDGAVIDKIVSDLTDSGYRVEIWKMFAPDYGVPQRRTRLIFMCVRNDLPGFPIKPKAEYENNYHSIEWAIGDLVNITDETIPNQSQYFRASCAKRGNGQGDEVNDRDKPAYTIRANPKSRVQFHYSLNRRLTVRECARIQTFPDNYYFKHSMTTSISQIGNAVPPILAHQIAQSVADYLTKLEAIDNG
jgi:DNA (cytosine-5)-methyltransferase 1